MSVSKSFIAQFLLLNNKPLDGILFFQTIVVLRKDFSAYCNRLMQSGMKAFCAVNCRKIYCGKRSIMKTIQWWLQIREFSLIWPKINKMANKGISNIPLFDIKIIQIWLDFVFISTSLEF